MASDGMAEEAQDQELPSTLPEDVAELATQLEALEAATFAEMLRHVLQQRPDLAVEATNVLIPEFCYPPVKVLHERRSVGVIKSFNPGKNWGFIDCQELREAFGNDVFLHGRQIGTYTPGTRVSFAVVMSKDNKPQAYDLQPVNIPGAPGATVLPLVTPNQGAGRALRAPRPMLGAPVTPGYAGNARAFMPGAPAGPGKRTAAAMAPVDDGPVQELGEFTGVIKSFVAKTRYGFIECPDLKALGYQNDAFLHERDLGGFAIGNTVKFWAFINSKGNPQAKNLQIASAVPAPGGFVVPALKRVRVV